jgi:hypothetical protein
MSFFILEGVYHLIAFGELAFDLIPGISYISQPTSAIIFASFGLILYRKWKIKALFVLLSTYCLWEITFDGLAWILSQPLQLGFIFCAWTATILISYRILKPKINLNHWSILPFFVATIFFLSDYPFHIYFDTGMYGQMVSEITVCLLTWYCVNPK